MTAPQEGSGRRRKVLQAGGGIFGLPFLGGNDANAAGSGNTPKSSKGPTNEVGKVVNGMKHRRLGGSETGLADGMG